MAVTGERGPKGDHGQTGDTGETGPAGPRGPRVLNRSQLLTMFLFVVAAFVVLAYRTEVNSNRLRRTSYNSCVGGRAIIEHFNSQQLAFAKLDEDNPLGTPAGRVNQQKRIQLYRDSVIPLPLAGYCDRLK